MTEFSSKVYIRAQQLLEDSFRLGFKILESDFRPRFIIGVWRGGAPTGIAIQELLDFYGVETDHISIRTSSYVGMEQQKTVRVHGLDYILNNVNAEDDLLIVDDVFDSGRSIEAIVETLQEKSRRNMPERVRIATVYYKPLRNKTQLTPDFFLHETDEWLVFPHELHGLTMEEIRQHKGLSLDFPEPVSEKSKVRREA
ncbi:MAG: hypoxanthine phosphoribosyltransferase [Alphaproteobacteria bacterium]|nr:MAG: hypoxanthine phosphoribosyltransferase [Alphaproteobacteria bacterium]